MLAGRLRSSDDGDATMNDSEWLASLESGSLVIVHGRGFYDDLIAARVERASKTMITVRGQRYRRSDGRQTGEGGFHRAWIAQPTPEVLDRIRRARLAREIRHAVERIAKTEIGLDALQAIRDAVQPLIDEQADPAAPSRSPGTRRNADARAAVSLPGDRQ